MRNETDDLDSLHIQIDVRISIATCTILALKFAYTQTPSTFT
jgi:hypothetical protein